MLITLTTDFGTRDPFVALMKGVNFSIAPGCAIVDITHGVPQEVLAGALALEPAAGAFGLKLQRDWWSFEPSTAGASARWPGPWTSRRPLCAAWRWGRWRW